MSHTQEVYTSIDAQLRDKLLFGHQELIKLFLVAYFARGHVLVEGPPGTGKTLTAKVMAALLARSFRRIQFTTDMLPSDLIGAQLFNPSAQAFEFIPGPLFAEFVIADEVNRTPPRTQSALLEAMEERQVTVEGNTMKLPAEFFVVATQNPQDFEGTFPLPESQLDRFMFKVILNHVSAKEDAGILEQVLAGKLPPDFSSLSPVAFDRGCVDHEAGSVRVDRSILDYTANILERTRNSKFLQWGASVRGGIALLKAARILALIEGRDFVIPDDVKLLAQPVLQHRVRLTPDAQISSAREGLIIDEIVKQVPFPS